MVHTSLLGSPAFRSLAPSARTTYLTTEANAFPESGTLQQLAALLAPLCEQAEAYSRLVAPPQEVPALLDLLWALACDLVARESVTPPAPPPSTPALPLPPPVVRLPASDAPEAPSTPLSPLTSPQPPLPPSSPQHPPSQLNPSAVAIRGRALRLGLPPLPAHAHLSRRRRPRGLRVSLQPSDGVPAGPQEHPNLPRLIGVAMPVNSRCLWLFLVLTADLLSGFHGVFALIITRHCECD
jgi:hypothetical protein